MNIGVLGKEKYSGNIKNSIFSKDDIKKMAFEWKKGIANLGECCTT